MESAGRLHMSSKTGIVENYKYRVYDLHSIRGSFGWETRKDNFKIISIPAHQYKTSIGKFFFLVDDGDIIKELKNNHCLTSFAINVSVEGDDGDNFLKVVDSLTGEPLFELEKIHEIPTD